MGLFVGEFVCPDTLGATVGTIDGATVGDIVGDTLGDDGACVG